MQQRIPRLLSFSVAATARTHTRARTHAHTHTDYLPFQETTTETGLINPGAHYGVQKDQQSHVVLSSTLAIPHSTLSIYPGLASLESSQ